MVHGPASKLGAEFPNPEAVIPTNVPEDPVTAKLRLAVSGALSTVNAPTTLLGLEAASVTVIVTPKAVEDGSTPKLPVTVPRLSTEQEVPEKMRWPPGWELSVQIPGAKPPPPVITTLELGPAIPNPIGASNGVTAICRVVVGSTNVKDPVAGTPVLPATVIV
jgi:hypothetical protein